MIELNPAKVDQETVRKQKRLELLKYATLPIFLLLLLAIFFLRTSIYNVVFNLAYNNKNYDLALAINRNPFFANSVEPYLLEYNNGVASIQAGKYTEAEKDFRSALKNNVPENKLCKVYVNLSLSVELQGDGLTNTETYEDALVTYSRAEATLYENNCASRDSTSQGKDAKAVAAIARIEEKRKNVIEKINNTDSSDNDNAKNTPEIDEKTLDSIKAEQNAARILKDKIKQYSNGINSSNLNSDKRW